MSDEDSGMWQMSWEAEDVWVTKGLPEYMRPPRPPLRQRLRRWWSGRTPTEEERAEIAESHRRANEAETEAECLHWHDVAYVQIVDAHDGFGARSWVVPLVAGLVLFGAIIFALTRAP